MGSLKFLDFSGFGPTLMAMITRKSNVQPVEVFFFQRSIIVCHGRVIFLLNYAYSREHFILWAFIGLPQNHYHDLIAMQQKM